MPRLIDADAIPYKKIMFDADEDDFYYGVTQPYIDRMPTIDAVPVVRCKDCVYSDTYPSEADPEMPLKCLGIRYGGVELDWFCEHGQRREDGDA